ncbi:hypothetical protein LCGC14_2797830 [marine sediment metagenome]|uniref:Uncharacterized protein n=1 Tax=marine sediment metagenome TaxID=412755 RepID=A0A0F8YNQ2_9ZZZZ
MSYSLLRWLSRMSWLTGEPEPPDYAFTKDGKKCTDCGEAVRYLGLEVARHAHKKPAPNCSGTKTFAMWDAERERKAELARAPRTEE